MRSLSLTVISILLATLIGEGLLRLAGLTPRILVANPHFTGKTWAIQDDEMGWTNREGEYLSNEFGNARMKFWPDGRRASWVQPEIPSEHSIFVMGGSFTQGYGVEDKETYVYRLNGLYPDIMFHNFGVGGYSTYQSLLRLRHILDNKSTYSTPELIIYGYIGDHERRNVATHRWVTSLTDSAGHYLIPPHVTITDHEISEHSMEIVREWPLETRLALVNHLHDAALRLSLLDRKRQRRNATNSLVQELESEAREAGSRFLVVLLNNVKEGFIPFLQEQDITYIDCVNPAFETDPRYRVGGDGHPSSVQHELWADCIHRHLATSGLISHIKRGVIN